MRARGITHLLLRHAAWVSPAHRKDWILGMQHELAHIPWGWAALRWAFGCLRASYRERMVFMSRMPPQLPRWLIALEMAVCLVPLNLLFLAIVSRALRGMMPFPDLLRFGSVALVGPVGLLLAVRVLFFARRAVARGILIAAAGLAGWTLFAYLAETLGNGAVPFPWREYVLIALLPAVAVAHLAYLNSQRPSSRSA